MEGAKGKGQRAKGKGQRAKGKGQRAKSKEQRAKGQEPRAKGRAKGKRLERRQPGYHCALADVVSGPPTAA